MLLTSVIAIGAMLLVASGGWKIVDPTSTRGALEIAGLPSGRSVVIALGIVEILIGASALAVPGPIPGIALTIVYLGFAGFVVYALRAGLPIQSCGCFGRVDTPPSGLHVALNGLFAITAASGAVVGIDPLSEVVLTDPVNGVAFSAFVILGVWIAFLMMTALPETLAAARLAGSRK